MIPQLITADEKHRAPGRKFRMHEFARLVRYVKPYTRGLVLGLILTVGFAGLHTLGIGTAFPVFQVLLEDEGLHGWADRTLAGHRLGVEFAPLSEPGSARIVKLKDDSVLAQAGAKRQDDLWTPSKPIDELMHELATVEDGATAELTIGRPGEQREVSAVVGELDWKMRLLRWTASLLPPDTRESRLRTLVYILMVLVVTILAANACRFLGESLVAGSVLHGMMDLRDELYDRTLRLPMSFFAETETSDLVTRFVQDIQEIQRGLVTLFGKAIREPIHALFLTATALILDWRVTLVVTLVIPFIAIIFLTVGRKAKKANLRLLKAYGEMIGALTASFQNLRVVKAYTAENQERAHLDTVDRRMLTQQLKLARLDAFLSPMLESVGVVAGSLLVVWLASLVLGGTLSTAKFATLGAVLATLFDPLRKLSDVYVRIQRSTAAAERIFGVLDRPTEVEEVRDAVELKPLQRAVEFDNVTFTYPKGGQPALSEVSLRIEKGETLAIVGPNGSGKTTLASMIPRLFDPSAGEVLYDGIDLRRAKLDSLRRQISWVSQEAVIFAATPVANITYGDPHPDRDRAIDSAVRAYADEFIRAIPGGYDAVLGERGTTLSGGQRQRLAIARAIYRDAPILIFDEATSQVDSESELKIQSAVREFAAGRTTIIIAHRLSTIQFAERIVVMDRGQIVDIGTHRELFERCALYQGLCETQFVGARG
jgi:ABC-type multidrug transport system fused ATPase/permease subunit